MEDQDPAVTGIESRPDQISEELAKYYKMLFSPKKTVSSDRKRIMDRLREHAIQSGSAQDLDAPIEDEEVREVMDRLPLGKQAGPNRIPNAVYRCMSKYFAPKLAPILRGVMKGAYELPKSMLDGDITVLFKKNTRLDPRNYRPLTMLNTDYKIYTKILANRL